jgi:hypothetical protein
VRQIEDQLRESQIFVKGRPPEPKGCPLLDEIRRRAHEKGMAIEALGRASRTGQYFYRTPKNIDLAKVAAAAEVLGGQLVIEWEPLG